MNKHDRMYQQIEKHGADLNKIFKTEFDNVKLCKKLLTLENKAHHATTCLCNTNTLDRLELTRQEEQTGIKQTTEEEQDIFFNKILDSVDKILNFKEKKIPVFINHDPRGYALKIKSEYCRGLQLHQDFGGYGILAPEFEG